MNDRITTISLTVLECRALLWELDVIFPGMSTARMTSDRNRPMARKAIEKIKHGAAWERPTETHDRLNKDARWSDDPS